MIKVSIIISIYNPPLEALVRCLNSVYSQDIDSLEVVLINNGADESLFFTIRSYVKKYRNITKYYYFKENVGYSKAVNKGISLSEGMYLHIVDSDDFLLEDTESFLFSLAKNKDFIDIIFFGSMLYNEELQTYYTHFSEKTFQNIPVQLKNTIIRLDKDTINPLFFAIPSDIWAKFIKRDFIIDNSIKFREDMQICAPGVFYFEMLNKYPKVYITSKIKYIYCIGYKNSVVSSVASPDLKIYKSAITYSKAVENICELITNTTAKNILRRNHISHLISIYNRIADVNKRSFFYEVKKYAKHFDLNKLNFNLRLKKNFSMFKNDSYYIFFLKNKILRSYRLINNRFFIKRSKYYFFRDHFGCLLIKDSLLDIDSDFTISYAKRYTGRSDVNSLITKGSHYDHKVVNNILSRFDDNWLAIRIVKRFGDFAINKVKLSNDNELYIEGSLFFNKSIQYNGLEVRRKDTIKVIKGSQFSDYLKSLDFNTQIKEFLNFIDYIISNHYNKTTQLLDPECFDAIPDNFIFNNGKYYFVDKEYYLLGGVNLNFYIFIISFNMLSLTTNSRCLYLELIKKYNLENKYDEYLYKYIMMAFDISNNDLFTDPNIIAFARELKFPGL